MRGAKLENNKIPSEKDALEVVAERGEYRRCDLDIEALEFGTKLAKAIEKKLNVFIEAPADVSLGLVGDLRELLNTASKPEVPPSLVPLKRLGSS